MIVNVSGRALKLAAVIGLLALMEALMLLSVRQESQTSDEAHNLFAGYLYLTAGDFSVGSAHPPLAKDVGALPLLALRPRVPPMPRGEPFNIHFQDGRIFLYSNHAEQMLFAARAAMTVFPLLLAVIVFLATREMFGAAPALIALTLTAFEPNILAHGPLTTNAVALAACLFVAVYAFWRYVVNPQPGRLAVVGIAGGLTLAAMHSGLILFPIWFLLALVEWLISPRGMPRSALAPDRVSGVALLATTSREQDRRAAVSGRRLTLRLLLAVVVEATLSVAVVWGFYAFRYAPIAGAPIPSLAPLLNTMASPPTGLSGGIGAFLCRRVTPHLPSWHTL